MLLALALPGAAAADAPGTASLRATAPLPRAPLDYRFVPPPCQPGANLEQVVAGLAPTVAELAPESVGDVRDLLAARPDLRASLPADLAALLEGQNATPCSPACAKLPRGSAVRHIEVRVEEFPGAFAVACSASGACPMARALRWRGPAEEETAAGPLVCALFVHWHTRRDRSGALDLTYEPAGASR